MARVTIGIQKPFLWQDVTPILFGGLGQRGEWTGCFVSLKMVVFPSCRKGLLELAFRARNGFVAEVCGTIQRSWTPMYPIEKLRLDDSSS